MSAPTTPDRGVRAVAFRDLLREPLRNGVYKPKEFHGRGVKVVNMKELFAYDRISDQPDSRVDLTSGEISKFGLRDGDLLFARRSFVLEGSGKCSLVVSPSEETTFESSMIRARVDSAAADPVWLYYFFRSPQGRALMAGIATRTAVSGITGTNLAALRLQVPELPAQHRTSAILSAMDDLVAINRRRVEALEEMARAIYREWFVRFRYPGHENATFVGSPLGPVPDGWTATTLGEVLELRYGRALTKENRRGGKVAVVSSAGVVGWHDQQLIDGPAIVVGRKGNVGSVTWVDGPAWPIDTAYFVDTDLPLRYVVEQLRRTEFLNTHAAVPGLSRDQAYSRPFLQPPSELMAQFSDLSQVLASQASAIAVQADRLVSMRDLLLPKLVTGQVDVSSLSLDALIEEPVA